MFRPAFRLVSAVFALCALCAVPAAAMLTATDEQALLHFTVLGPDGKPLAGANVSLEGNDPAHNFSGNTDDAGQVDLLAAEGDSYFVVWNSPDGPQKLEQKIPVARAAGAQEGSFKVQFKGAPKAAPSPTSVLLDVNVTNFDGRSIPRAKIVLRGRKSGREFTGTTDGSGKTQIRVEKGETYDIRYMSVVGPYTVDEIDLLAKMRATGGNLHVQYDDNTVELKNIYFETGKATLKKSSFKELDLLVYGMKEVEPELVVEIAGHTDNVGGEEYNMKLSQSRAESVRDYLLKKGIAAERVTAVGYGYSQPIEDNSTEAGRARNRRTEVRILGGKR